MQDTHQYANQLGEGRLSHVDIQAHQQLSVHFNDVELDVILISYVGEGQTEVRNHASE